MKSHSPYEPPSTAPSIVGATRGRIYNLVIALGVPVAFSIGTIVLKFIVTSDGISIVESDGLSIQKEVRNFCFFASGPIWLPVYFVLAAISQKGGPGDEVFIIAAAIRFLFLMPILTSDRKDWKTVTRINLWITVSFALIGAFLLFLSIQT